MPGLGRVGARPEIGERPRGAAAFAIRRFDRIGQTLTQSSPLELHAIDDDLQHRPTAQRRRDRHRRTTTARAVDRAGGAKPFLRTQRSSIVTASIAVRLFERLGGDGFGGAVACRLRERLSSRSLPARRPPARPDSRPSRRRPGRSKPISRRVPAGSSPSCARDDLRRFAHDFLSAVAAERAPDARKQQPHVVVDLGRRADRRPRVADAVLLPDGDRRRDAVDAIDVRLFHPLEELTRVGRQRLDVAALAFRVDRVEGERRLARSADAGDDDQLADRQRHVDVLEVVRARAAHDDVCGVGQPRDGRVGHAWCTTLLSRICAAEPQS